MGPGLEKAPAPGGDRVPILLHFVRFRIHSSGVGRLRVNQISSNQPIRQKGTQAHLDFDRGFIVTSGDLAYDRLERFEIAQNDRQNRSIEV
jgi:hypothetical protein